MSYVQVELFSRNPWIINNDIPFAGLFHSCWYGIRTCPCPPNYRSFISHKNVVGHLLGGVNSKNRRSLGRTMTSESCDASVLLRRWDLQGKMENQVIQARWLDAHRIKPKKKQVFGWSLLWVCPWGFSCMRVPWELVNWEPLLHVSRPHLIQKKAWTE